MTIDRAVDLLAKDDGEAALEALVEHWRTWPGPALGDAIDALAAKLAAKLPRVAGDGSTSDRQAFAQAAAERRSITLPRLFEALPRSNGVIARERIFALAAFPVSPLVSAGIVRWLEKPPFDGKSRARCFPPALDVLGKHRDPRAVPVLQKLAHPDQRPLTIRKLGLSSWKPITVLAKEALLWPVPRPATREEAAALAALNRKLAEAPAPPRAGVKVEALFAAVYADPTDDGARLVLADYLQEAGDPRGELIAIQMARASAGHRRSRREKELIAQWGRTWVGPLDPLLMREGLEFERGFLSRGAFNGHAEPGCGTHLEWSTVTHLEVSHAGRTPHGARAILLGPAVKSLRHVIGAGHADLRGIAEAASELPWESLHCALWSLEHGTAAAFLMKLRLPALTRLALGCASPGALSGATLDWLALFLDTPTGKQLHHLDAAIRPSDFGGLIDLGTARKLTTVTLRPTSRALALTYDTVARGVVLSLDPSRTPMPLGLELLEAAVRSARKGTIDRAVLKLTQPKQAKTLKLDGLKAALDGVPLELA